MQKQLREEIARLHAQICSGLAEPNRILLLYTLEEGPHSVGELAEELELPQPTVSRHLNILKERGMVCAERERQQIVYSLADERVIQALDLLRAVLGERLESQYTVSRSTAEKIPF